MSNAVQRAPRRPQRTSRGRRRGVPNHFTAFGKALIEDTLWQLGGVTWLKRAAEENPAAFMALLGRLLPKQVNLDTPAEGTLAQLLEQVQTAAVARRVDLEARRALS